MRFTILLASLLLLPTFAFGQQARPDWPCAGKVDPAYVQASEATGGKVLLVKPTEIAGTSADIIAASRHSETILRAGGTVEQGVHEFAVPVDSTVESVYFFVSMQCLQRATLITPSGAALNVGDPGVQYHQFESLRLFIVQSPAPGSWMVSTFGRGLMSVIVTAKTDLRLGGVQFLEAGVPLVAETKLGKNLRLEAMLFGAGPEVVFRFVGRDAAPIMIIDDLTLESDSDSFKKYSGPVTTPPVDFRLSVTGYDVNGFPFERVESHLSIALMR